MSFFKRLRKIVHPVYGLIEKNKNTQSKLNERDAQLAQLQGQNDPAKQLEAEQKDYDSIDKTSLDQAKADAQRAGTYSDTLAGNTALQGEAGARARGLKTASQARINALREKMGLVQSPSGSV